MIVADASVILDCLLAAPGTQEIMKELRAEGKVHVPHLLDLEIVQVLRRHCLHRGLTAERGSQVLDDLARMPLTRHPHHLYTSRIWELRHNLSAYDAAYVALAEFLNARLITRDKRLAVAPGHHARIEII